jgi:hypothetical protein
MISYKLSLTRRLLNRVGIVSKILIIKVLTDFPSGTYKLTMLGGRRSPHDPPDVLFYHSLTHKELPGVKTRRLSRQLSILAQVFDLSTCGVAQVKREGRDGQIINM